jgi:hypothetical protein
LRFGWARVQKWLGLRIQGVGKKKLSQVSLRKARARKKNLSFWGPLGLCLFLLSSLRTENLLAWRFRRLLDLGLFLLPLVAYHSFLVREACLLATLFLCLLWGKEGQAFARSAFCQDSRKRQDAPGGLKAPGLAQARAVAPREKTLLIGSLAKEADPVVIRIPVSTSPEGILFHTPKGDYSVAARGDIGPAWERLHAYFGREALWVQPKNRLPEGELGTLEALLSGALLQKVALDRKAQAGPDGWEMSQRCQAIRWVVKTLWDLYDEKKAAP